MKNTRKIRKISKEYIFEYSVKYSPDENGPCQKEDNK